MGLSTYAMNKAMDHILKVASYTPATHLYIGLSTTNPLADGSGIAEPSGGSYARVLCDDWDAAADREVVNSALIEFAQATASWGNIAYIFVSDALTGGNMIAFGTLTQNKNITTGGTFSIETGMLHISIDEGIISNYMANAILDHIFKNTVYTPATHLYVCLCDESPDDSSDGTSISEPDAADYARILHDTWNISSGGKSTNDGSIEFTEAVASWGTISHTALTDALTAGNMLLYATLDTESPIVVGAQAIFPDESLEYGMQ